jgi:DinB superfamily
MVLMATKKKQAKGRKKPTTKRSTSKAPAKASAKFAASPKTPPRASFDKPLRDHVLFLLKGGGAHASFDDTLKDWPLEFAGIKVAKFPHTAWMLLEHIRLGQWDILEFSRNSKHVSPKWPEGYWPASAAPPSEEAWKASMAACEKDLRAMERLVADAKVDLFAKIPWGDGQTVLREALLMADHNAYHLGQLMMLRKSLGV